MTPARAGGWVSGGGYRSPLDTLGAGVQFDSEWAMQRYFPPVVAMFPRQRRMPAPPRVTTARQETAVITLTRAAAGGALVERTYLLPLDLLAYLVDLGDIYARRSLFVRPVR